MATIKQGILGGFSGKIGNIVGSSWKGVAVMKAQPLSVANPKTAAQVENRTTFSTGVAFAKSINAEIIKPLWDRFATRMSGFNMFMQLNYVKFKAGSDLAGKVKLGQGVMASTPMTSVSAPASHLEVNFTWTNDNGEGYKLSDDEVYAAVWNSAMEVLGFSAASATRASETLDVSCSKLTAGETVYTGICFRRKDGTIVSETTNTDALVVA